MNKLLQPPWGHWHEIDPLISSIESAIIRSAFLRNCRPEWTPTIHIHRWLDHDPSITIGSYCKECLDTRRQDYGTLGIGPCYVCRPEQYDIWISS